VLVVEDDPSNQRGIRILLEREGLQIATVGDGLDALEGNRAACLEAGMNDFLSKPVRLQQLQRDLDCWLG
jgi:CheY-like chemotaxis protein